MTPSGEPEMVYLHGAQGAVFTGPNSDISSKAWIVGPIPEGSDDFCNASHDTSSALQLAGCLTWQSGATEQEQMVDMSA